jgi:hypothetical protein
VLKDEPLSIFSDPIAIFLSVPKVEAFVQTDSQTFSNQRVLRPAGPKRRATWRSESPDSGGAGWRRPAGSSSRFATKTRIPWTGCTFTS